MLTIVYYQIFLQMVVEGGVSIELLEAGISQLGRSRVEIESESALRREELRFHRTKQNIPLYSLPNELIVEILKTTVHTPTFNAVEIALSHISAHLRHITLNTPSLWTSITIHHSCLARTAAYLARSETCPLDLVICLDKTFNFIGPIFELLYPHVARWRFLHLIAECRTSVYHATLYLTSITVPILETLRVTVVDTVHSNAINSLPSNIFSGGAPSLLEVHMEDIPVQQCLPPMASVKHLKLVSPRTTKLRGYHSVFSTLQCLTHLEIHNHITHTFDTDPHVTLPSLLSLKIFVADTVTISAMLIFIDAPQLVSLTIGSLIEYDLDVFYESRLPDDAPKFPLLRTLTLNQDPMQEFTAFTWQKIMLAFPTITNFIFGYEAVDAFYLALQKCYPNAVLGTHAASADQPTTEIEPNTSQGNPGWPNLKTLAFRDNSRGADIGMGALVDMLSVRKTMGHPLRTVNLHPNHSGLLTAEDAQFLHELNLH